MTDPVTALGVAFVLAVVVAAIGWPRYGLAARWRNVRRTARRVQIEDALKHIYDCEYRGIPCTRQSLAGALAIAGDDATGLLDRLIAHGLVLGNDDTYSVSPEGRAYALRVIRMHRLWERYLADETGTEETEWHAQAELKEHLLTSDEADALSAQMGNPRFDPHGDPIPTSAGDLPGRRGVPLSRLPAGQAAEIVHIEDEPGAVYAQLVAQNLHPGLIIRVLESTGSKIRFEAEGSENILAPVVAVNVTVVPVERELAAEAPHDSLARLRPGETGRVTSLSRRCRGQQRRRLMDLGLVPGTLVRAEIRSAAGDPTAYSIRGATIALRRSHAELVYIIREPAA